MPSFVTVARGKRKEEQKEKRNEKRKRLVLDGLRGEREREREREKGREKEGEFSRGLAIKSTAGIKERWLNSLQDRLPSIALVPFSHGSWYASANKTRSQPV